MTKAKTAPAGAGTQYREKSSGDVLIEKIRVSSNYRKIFNKRSMEELTENIKKVGVLQPIILRQAEDQLVLVAGERRLRAAKAAGMDRIKARVLDINEEQAAEIQALENLHREDLGPVEEARAFKTLLDQGKYEVKGLAERIDKSEGYVYRALRLLELPEKVLEAIEAGTLSPAHGHQLLRAPKERWDELTENLFGEDGTAAALTATAFAEHVSGLIGKDLSAGYFPKDKPYGGEEACAGCSFNSGNQGMLFEGAQKGQCMRRECFDKKNEAWLDDLSATAQEKAKKTGLQWVGAAPERGYGELRGHKILSGEEVKLAKDPKKYGIGVVTGSCYGNGDQPRIVTVRLKEKERDSAKTPASNYDWERDSFVRNAQHDALRDAEALEALKVKASRKIREEVALVLLQRNDSERFLGALGVKKLVMSKLTEDQLAAAMIFFVRGSGWHPKRKAIEAEAKKKALAEYATMKAAEAAAKKDSKGGAKEQEDESHE